MKGKSSFCIELISNTECEHSTIKLYSNYLALNFFFYGYSSGKRVVLLISHKDANHSLYRITFCVEHLMHGTQLA